MQPSSSVSRRALVLVVVLGLAAVLAGAASAGAGQGSGSGQSGATQLRASRDALEFYAPDPHSPNKIQCAIYDGYAELSEAFCMSFPPRAGKATLQADGSVVLCRGSKGAADACGLGNAGEGTRTLKVGRQVNVGRFRCTVRSAGVECVVRATGQGFLFSSRQERAVGGAAAERTTRRART